MMVYLCRLFGYIVLSYQVLLAGGCDEFHTSTTGSISSPNFPENYPSFSDCTYILNVPDTASITITFHDWFKLEANFDYLYYGTGLDADIAKAEGSLTNYILPAPLTLEDGSVWLRFVSDNSVQYEGFSFTWSAEALTTPSYIAPTTQSVFECEEPTAYPNSTFITDDGIPYTDGNYVIYTCDAGYTMVGDADYVVRICRLSDSRELMEWNGPLVQCEAIECPRPTVPSNGVIVTPVDYTDLGGSITYSCSIGFELQGPPLRVCVENATWSGQEPQCIVACSSDAFQYDNNTCYVPSDVTATWTTARSSCESLASPISNLAHVKDADRHTFLEQRLRGTASGDYWIGGVVGRTWTWDSSGDIVDYSSWAPGEPNNVGGLEECVNLNPSIDAGYKWNDEDCSRSVVGGYKTYFICQFDTSCPNEISDGFINLDNIQVDYQSYCMAFVTSPREKVAAGSICDDNGGRLVEIKDQDMQTFMENELIHRVSQGDLIEAFWWIGITAVDSVTTWLWTDGTVIDTPFWGPGEPNNLATERCVGMSGHVDYDWNNYPCNEKLTYLCHIESQIDNCGFPGDPSHGGSDVTSITDTFPMMSVITFYCDKGFNLRGSMQRTCLSTGAWSGDPAMCLSVSCMASPPSLPLGYFEVISTDYRGMVVYRCEDELVLVGDPTVYCNESGEWSALNAKCTGMSTTPLPSTTILTNSLPTTAEPLLTTTPDLTTTEHRTTATTTTKPFTTTPDITTTKRKTTAMLATTTAEPFTTTPDLTTTERTTTTMLTSLQTTASPFTTTPELPTTVPTTTAMLTTSLQTSTESLLTTTPDLTTTKPTTTAMTPTSLPTATKPLLLTTPDLTTYEIQPFTTSEDSLTAILTTEPGVTSALLTTPGIQTPMPYSTETSTITESEHITTPAFTNSDVQTSRAVVSTEDTMTTSVVTDTITYTTSVASTHITGVITNKGTTSYTTKEISLRTNEVEATTNSTTGTLQTTSELLTTILESDTAVTLETLMTSSPEELVKTTNTDAERTTVYSKTEIRTEPIATSPKRATSTVTVVTPTNIAVEPEKASFTVLFWSFIAVITIFVFVVVVLVACVCRTTPRVEPIDKIPIISSPQVKKQAWSTEGQSSEIMELA